MSEMIIENDGPCWSCTEGEGCPQGCDCDCPVCILNNQRSYYFYNMTTNQIKKFMVDIGLM